MEIYNAKKCSAKAFAICSDRAGCLPGASQITGVDITPVHEEAMRQAREENEKNGVFFKEDEW